MHYSNERLRNVLNCHENNLHTKYNFFFTFRSAICCSVYYFSVSSYKVCTFYLFIKIRFPLFCFAVLRDLLKIVSVNITFQRLLNSKGQHWNGKACRFTAASVCFVPPRDPDKRVVVEPGGGDRGWASLLLALISINRGFYFSLTQGAFLTAERRMRKWHGGICEDL